MELKSSLTFEAAGVTPPGDATTPKDDTAVVNTDNIIFLIFIMSN
jgi:ATP-dependent protease Clp ATPase subunit